MRAAHEYSAFQTGSKENSLTDGSSKLTCLQAIAVARHLLRELLENYRRSYRKEAIEKESSDVLVKWIIEFAPIVVSLVQKSYVTVASDRLRLPSRMSTASSS